jgi:hypothetical protein
MRMTLSGRVLGIALLATASLAAGLCTVGAANAQVVPFQARKALTCTGTPTNCRATFAPVAAGKRLKIDFVSCFVDAPSSVDPNKAAFIGVDNAQGAAFRHTLRWEIQVTSGRKMTIVSQPVLMIVAEGKKPDIAIPFPGAIAATGDCAISGTLTTLP